MGAPVGIELPSGQMLGEHAIPILREEFDLSPEEALKCVPNVSSLEELFQELRMMVRTDMLDVRKEQIRNADRAGGDDQLSGERGNGDDGRAGAFATVDDGGGVAGAGSVEPATATGERDEPSDFGS